MIEYSSRTASPIQSPDSFSLSRIDRLAGDRLRLLRVGRRWSVESLAVALGVPGSTIKSWEDGTRRIPAFTLITLAELARVDLQWFFADDAWEVLENRSIRPDATETGSMGRDTDATLASQASHAVDTKIGRNLKQRREDFDLTRADFAKALGVSITDIERWEENGERVPPRLLLLASNILSCDVAIFFDGLPP